LLLDASLIYILIILGAIIIGVVTAYFFARRRKRRKTLQLEETETSLTGLPFKIEKSVSSDEAQHAKEELRILGLEREILSDAIRRLYEAHAEGKINEQERERLAQTYKSRMMTVKDAISKGESVVALHEFEAMQEDLMKLFSERFEEISGKIEELRTKAEMKAIKEIPIKPQDTETHGKPEEKTETEEKAKKKKKTPPKPSPKTEAEKRIEEIRNEVEKVLDRLGQMEIES
jgi:hypothetical protein